MAKSMITLCDKCEQPITEKDPGRQMQVLLTTGEENGGRVIDVADVHLKPRCIRGLLNVKEYVWAARLEQFDKESAKANGSESS